MCKIVPRSQLICRNETEEIRTPREVPGKQHFSDKAAQNPAQ
jgi:hypothetical protein